MIDSPYLIKPGSKVRLEKIRTEDTGKFKSKQDGEAASRKNLDKIHELQEVLYAQGKHSMLIVLQAMDAAGKDGTIDYIFSGMNPQGCQVTSFKVPTPLEKAHDFLWRIHIAAPPMGMFGIFNRSHYESVVVERIHGYAPKEMWKHRYDHINNFERLLANEGTTILKFYLHISKKEQAERMKARLSDPTKNWKFNAADLAERKLWDDYMSAYNDAIGKCSTEHAPWYVVPADKKWYRNWVISDVILRALKSLDLKFPDPIPDIAKFKVV
ncbi:MAG: polyphosphate kinase 2 family protein [Burkholderiales bacterium]|nr:polyphosphate kinase 2 family protein [Phycisphaerae bacterium]